VISTPPRRRNSRNVREAKIALAASPALSHNASMTDEFPFSIWVEPNPLYTQRFRWTVREGERATRRSPRSYCDRQEAENEANIAMAKMELRRIGMERTMPTKRPSSCGGLVIGRTNNEMKAAGTMNKDHNLPSCLYVFQGAAGDASN
jgi:predicted P-loop ATPase